LTISGDVLLYCCWCTVLLNARNHVSDQCCRRKQCYSDVCPCPTDITRQLPTLIPSSLSQQRIIVVSIRKGLNTQQCIDDDPSSYFANTSRTSRKARLPEGSNSGHAEGTQKNTIAVDSLIRRKPAREDRAKYLSR